MSVQEIPARSSSFFACLDQTVCEVHKQGKKERDHAASAPVRTEQAQSIITVYQTEIYSIVYFVAAASFLRPVSQWLRQNF